MRFFFINFMRADSFYLLINSTEIFHFFTTKKIRILLSIQVIQRFIRNSKKNRMNLIKIIKLFIRIKLIRF